MSQSNLQYFCLICDRKDARKFHIAMVEAGVVAIDGMYGKGSAKAGALAQALGFETEEQKAVLTGLVHTPDAKKLMEKLLTEHNFKDKNTGIAFTVPVGGLMV